MNLHSIHGSKFKTFKIMLTVTIIVISLGLIWYCIGKEIIIDVYPPADSVTITVKLNNEIIFQKSYPHPFNLPNQPKEFDRIKGSISGVDFSIQVKTTQQSDANARFSIMRGNHIVISIDGGITFAQS